MTPDEMDEIRLEAAALLERHAKAHTQQNLDRLQRELAGRGWKLTGTIRRKSAFTLTDPNGTKISGLSLASVEGLLAEMLSPKP
ncbi:hypothetical protein [Sphingobium sp. DN12]|uniref:hypothetical protein n=1 Tax=Sphingobium sp. DN12 TaxID=3378073 RepID=UPI003DA542D9